MDTKTDTKPDLRICLADLVCGVRVQPHYTIFKPSAASKIGETGETGKNAVNTPGEIRAHTCLP
jgi:hypothetical protein